MEVCPLCSSLNATLAHITNMCNVALKQERFTWRHDSVLQYFTTTIKSLTTHTTEVFADIPGFRINGGTIPADILVSVGEGSKPDLVIVDRISKKVTLLELTCSLPGSSDKAHKVKNTRYTQLSEDLEEKGYQVFLMPFEVMSSGHIAKPCKLNILNTLRQFNVRLKINIFVNLVKIGLLCTMSVWPIPHFPDLSTLWTNLLGVNCSAVRRQGSTRVSPYIL